MDNKSIVLLLAVVAGAGCGCQKADGPDSAASQRPADDTVRVKIVTAERKTLKRTTTQPATVHAFYQAELHAKVSGYLKSLHVDIGSDVDVDTVLATIAVPEMEKARERQQAMIAQLAADEVRQVAATQLAAAKIEAAKAMRDQAAAEVKQAVAQLNAVEVEFKRVQELVANKAVGGELLDEARKKLESSQAGKAAAEAALESSQANVSVAEQQLAVAGAESSAAEAATKVAGKQLEEMDVLMSFATLTAPFAGVVIQRHVDPGDLVRNTQTAADAPRMPLFTIAQIDKVRVRIAVPENDAPWANIDDTVAMRFRTLKGRTFDGTISRVTRSLDQSTRTMLLEVDLPNPDRVLMPGMYGEATVILEETPDALVLPAGAVRFDESGRAYLYVLTGDNTVQIVDVQTGADDGKQIEITEGLDANARVVDSMIGRFASGQQVRVEGE